LKELALRQVEWVNSLDNKVGYSNPVLERYKLLPIIRTKKKKVELFSELTTEVLSYLPFEDQQKLLLLSCTAQQCNHTSVISAALSAPRSIGRAIYSFFKK
jgi:hypothetical protein